MIGFEVIAPKPRPFEWRRKRQRTVKRGIVRASSSVALAARWLATLPFAGGHAPFAARAACPAAGPASSDAAASATASRSTPPRYRRAERRSAGGGAPPALGFNGPGG